LNYNRQLKKITAAFFFVAAAAYPLLVFYFLVLRKTPVWTLSLATIALGLFGFMARSSRNGGKNVLSPLAPIAAGIVTLITGSVVGLKLYPVLVDFILFVSFGSTLFNPPSMVLRFASLIDKSIPFIVDRKKLEKYYSVATFIWCVFFVVNGCVASILVFWASDAVWSYYTGGISYLLMALLLVVEYLLLKRMENKMAKAVPLSRLQAGARDRQAVVCYEGNDWRKTWGDFLDESRMMREIIRREDASGAKQSWLLHCEDCWYFLVSFAALLQCKKEIILSANISPLYIDEIRGKGGVPFLTDQQAEDSLHIPSLLEKMKNEALPEEEIPSFNGDDTSFIMYTSGSTGKPKAVKQRLTEFETDNRFILSKWGDEFLKRRVCSTVSQHHIYGLLFSIMLPFTAGVPFKRKRIEYPEEFVKPGEGSYMIITVPAFLKRSTEAPPPALNLTSPWIFTSGGVLPKEVAEKTNELFGFWPVEVYGSTETSGIAWRQSVNGLEWTPFDNAQITQNADGCLIIRSPYIKDPAGFETADLADILPDGRFLLKGRIDSVVKIEEKRVSLTEVESRLLAGGLAADVCVIPMEDRRQYLAAALAFNEEGKKRFSGAEKKAINEYFREYLSQFFEGVVIPKKWRYLERLPLDSQGKKKRETIRALFDNPEQENMTGFDSLEKPEVLERTETSVKVAFSIPPSSPYFDGHFPGFAILPAVAQTDIVLRFAAQYLNMPLAAKEIKRIKFTNLVKPDVPLVLNIEKKSAGLSYVLTGGGAPVYSQGSLVL
jgi:uncharacterized membrane protein/acyl-CoA synthetase (AMP-forming)/AMP-acid ligase II/3-hydroxymyristoyl/3-hydroxydecanoyl-(acyl carrier protein) dehydratase